MVVDVVFLFSNQTYIYILALFPLNTQSELSNGKIKQQNPLLFFKTKLLRRLKTNHTGKSLLPK